MKKTIVLLSVILLGMLATWYSCEKDPEETCYQDEICEGHFVTACCTEDECFFKYNGKEYAEDQLDELEADMGCSAAIGVLKSGSQEDDSSVIIEKLRALMNRARENCRACQ
jgi:hypothetical protein